MNNTSLIKYPGGKESELKYILPNCPKVYKRYFEPFVGGGSVYLNIKAEKYYINDKSEDLINLYEMIQSQDKDFFLCLEQINRNWKLISRVIENDSTIFLDMFDSFKDNQKSISDVRRDLVVYLSHNRAIFRKMLSTFFNYYVSNFTNEIIANVSRKFICLKKFYDNNILNPEDIKKNIECGFKAAFYTHFRFLNNKATEIELSVAAKTAIYVFLRDMCYSSMFRYNKKGDFNVPYGGLSYNGKTFDDKIKQYRDSAFIEKLRGTEIDCLDFEDFLLKNDVKKEDFIFLDPPYDSNFSCYDKNSFGKQEQKRLSEYLIHSCKGYFMLVIKNTDFIKSLYRENRPCANGNQLKINKISKKYRVSFKNRNDKETEHLFITNY